jgi:hypothetical protein
VEGWQQGEGGQERLLEHTASLLGSLRSMTLCGLGVSPSEAQGWATTTEAFPDFVALQNENESRNCKQ